MAQVTIPVTGEGIATGQVRDRTAFVTTLSQPSIHYLPPSYLLLRKTVKLALAGLSAIALQLRLLSQPGLRMTKLAVPLVAGDHHEGKRRTEHGRRKSKAPQAVKPTRPCLILVAKGRIELLTRGISVCSHEVTTPAPIYTDLRTFSPMAPEVPPECKKPTPEDWLSARCVTTNSVAPRPGLEPGTYGLTVRRSTN
jgi:hypothetical protein